MRLLIVGVALAVLCAPGVSPAQPLDRAALNQRQQDVTTCAAFYDTMAVCVGQADPALRGHLMQGARALKLVAVMVGQRVGMSGEALASRYRLTGDRLRQEVRSDCANVSTLMQRYGQSCKAMAEALR